MKPKTEIDIKNSNILLNDNTNINLKFSVINSNDNNYNIGFKGAVDLFIQKGLKLNNSLTKNFFHVADYVKNKTFDKDNNEVINYKWTKNNNVIKEHPMKNSGITIINPDDGLEWSWYIIDTPYSSYSKEQPKFILETLNITPLEDNGAIIGKDHLIKTRTFFRLGNDAENNPDIDPPIINSDMEVGVIRPQLIIIDKKNDAKENEISSGPNYPVKYTINVNVAKNKKINNIQLKEVISNNLLLFDKPNNVIYPDTFSLTKNIVNSSKNPTVINFNHEYNNKKQTLIFTYLNENYTGLGGNDFIFEYYVYVPKTDIFNSDILDGLNKIVKVNEDTILNYSYNNITNYIIDNNDILLIKHLCIQKYVKSNDNIIIPTSNLDYYYDIQLSDFYSIDNVNITDILSDGHYDNIDNIELKFRNSIYSIDNLLINDKKNDIINTNDKNIVNRIEMSIDLNKYMKMINEEYFNNNDTKIKGGLVNYGVIYEDIFNDGLYNYDLKNDGKFSFTISYNTKVGQLYYSRLDNINDKNNSISKIDIGDYIKSNITISSKNYLYEENKLTNNILNDTCRTFTNIGSIDIKKYIYAVNGNNTFNNTSLNPNDLVTYRVKLNLSHQNIQDFRLNTFLALPIENVNNLEAEFSNSNLDEIPKENIIKYGPKHSFYKPDNVNILNPKLIIQENTNSFILEYGNYQMPYYDNIGDAYENINNRVIDILYTVRINDEPTENQLLMTNQSSFITKSTNGNEISNHDYVGIILNQPVLEIENGIASFEDNSYQTYDKSYITKYSALNILHNTNGFTKKMDINNHINTNGFNIDRGMEVKFVYAVKNIGNYDAHNVKVYDNESNGINNINVKTIELYDGNGIKYDINDDNENLLIDGINIGSIEISNPVRVLIVKGYVGNENLEITKDTKVINKTYIKSYSNNEKSFKNFVRDDIFDESYCIMRNCKIDKYINYKTGSKNNYNIRNIDSLTIGEIVRVESKIKIPRGKINSLCLRDEIDFLFKDTNSGVELLKTRIKSKKEVVKQENYRNFQYNYFGDYMNKTKDEEEIIITQLLRISDRKYNNKNILGQLTRNNNYIHNNHVAHSNKLDLSIYLLINYVDTSNHDIINMKDKVRLMINEPSVNITKNIQENGRLSKGDIITYEIDVIMGYDLGSGKAYNLKFSDFIPQSLKIISFYEVIDGKEVHINYENNDLNHDIMNMYGGWKHFYVKCEILEYHSMDTIKNEVFLTYDNIDTKLNIKEIYPSPNDNEEDIDYFKKLYENNDIVYRSYNYNDSVIMKTKPILNHELNNYSDNNRVRKHKVDNKNIGSTIGDIMISKMKLQIPKGKTYLDNIILHIPNNINNIKENKLEVIKNDNLDYEDIALVGEYEDNNIRFNISRLINNNSNEEQDFELLYYFYIDNTKNNIAGKLIDIDYTISVKNSDDKDFIIKTKENKLYTKILEPKMSIKQEIIEEPLRNDDYFIVKITMDIVDGINNTYLYNPEIMLFVRDTIKDFEIISIDKGWFMSGNYRSKSNSIIYFYYNNNDEENIDMKKGLIPNTKHEIYLKYYLNDEKKMEYNEKYNIDIRNSWSSQEFNTSSLFFKILSQSNIFRHGESRFSTKQINNYLNLNTLDVYVRKPFEKYRVGLMIEDALDFDYDYEDLVFNVMYKIYRSKKGVKQIIGDFHLNARGASYDHTFGINIPSLKKYNGKYSVNCYQGHDDKLIDMKKSINSYLDNNENDELTFTNLKNDNIPIIISTKKLLPPDGAKEGYEFTTNTADRTDKVKDWIKPGTARIVIDFEDGLFENNLFMPYIDVRGPYNDSINPKYNDYEYRFDLKTRVDVSKRKFDYTNFPKILITPIDVNIVKDNGYTDNTNSLKDAYKSFVDYITNSKYPDISNMKDMINIDDRINDMDEMFKNNIDTNKLLDMTKKDKMNEYHNLNIFRMGIDNHKKTKVKIINGDNDYFNIENEYIHIHNNNLLVGIDNNHSLSSNDIETNKLFENIKLLKIKKSINKFVGIDKNHNIILDGKIEKDDKKYYDVVLFKDTYLLTIDFNLKLDSDSIGIGELKDMKFIKIDCNKKFIVLLTTDNKLYILNENSNRHIFEKKIIIDFEIDNNVVLLKDDNNNIYCYDMSNDTETDILISNVNKFSCYTDNDKNLGYGVFLLNNGLVVLKDILGKTPEINENNNIIYETKNDIIKDVIAYENSIVIKYN